jgi:pimeloyl-ACP methyl ester carboxylesterase
VNTLTALSIPHPVAIAGDPTVLKEAPHFLYYQSPWSARQLWSHDFAQVDYIYRTWSPDFDVPANEIADIKATLRVPGAVEGALGYYWSFFSEGSENAGPPPNSKIEVPSLILYGDADMAVNQARFDQAASAFAADYQAIRLPGVGHLPHLEDPESVSTAIVAFLGAHRH